VAAMFVNESGQNEHSLKMSTWKLQGQFIFFMSGQLTNNSWQA
jgi:hypothetical protein